MEEKGDGGALTPSLDQDAHTQQPKDVPSHLHARRLKAGAKGAAGPRATCRPPRRLRQGHSSRRRHGEALCKVGQGGCQGRRSHPGVGWRVVRRRLVHCADPSDVPRAAWARADRLCSRHGPAAVPGGLVETRGVRTVDQGLHGALRRRAHPSHRDACRDGLGRGLLPGRRRGACAAAGARPRARARAQVHRRSCGAMGGGRLRADSARHCEAALAAAASVAQPRRPRPLDLAPRDQRDGGGGARGRRAAVPRGAQAAAPRAVPQVARGAVCEWLRELRLADAQLCSAGRGRGLPRRRRVGSRDRHGERARGGQRAARSLHRSRQH